jgi:5-carboxymethyl-2-hydroxymuconate isomerase
MSHMTLEYSGNLAGAGLGELCSKLANFMTSLRVGASPVYPAGGVRVRAIACPEFCIADGSLHDAGFVHAILKIGAGRSPEIKEATSHGLFDIMKTHFATLYSERGLALSLELNEFSESGTLKHNNLHARLRNT